MSLYYFQSYHSDDFMNLKVSSKYQKSFKVPLALSHPKQTNSFCCTPGHVQSMEPTYRPYISSLFIGPIPNVLMAVAVGQTSRGLGVVLPLSGKKVPTCSFLLKAFDY